MSRITELNDELQAVRDQKAYLIRHGAENTDQGIVGLEEREADLFRKISEEESREASEAIAEDVAISDQPYIMTVDGEEPINFREWITDEGSYQVVTIGVRKKLYALEYKIEKMNRLFDQERQQYRDQIAAADAAADAKYNELYEQFHDLKNEDEDKERKLQAAATEIETLKQQLAMVETKPETSAPTNKDNSLAEVMKKARESRRAIYNVQKDSLEINYTAKFADTDEEFTDKVIYIGKYRQMSNEEAARFCAELEAAKQAEVANVPEADKPVELVEEQFRNDLQPPEIPVTAVPEHTIDGEVDAVTTGQVTRQEFEELKTRVDILFQNQDKSAVKEAA